MNGEPCCDGCGDGSAPCDSAPSAALVAGVTSELAMAKWFLDNRWTIIGTSFAAGAVFFATVAYFANRNPR